MIVDRIVVEYRVWPEEGEPSAWKKVEVRKDNMECYNYDTGNIVGIAEAAVHEAIELGHRHLPKPRGLNSEAYGVVEFRWLGQECFKLRINIWLIPNVHARNLPTDKKPALRKRVNRGTKRRVAD